jgi:dihydrofolate reductase
MGERPVDRLVEREPSVPSPVFVLTHHPHPSITMEGGTLFHFVNNGIESALERAFAVADGGDHRLGAGPATIQQQLETGLVAEMHLAVVPIGNRFFDHPDGGPDGYRCIEF